MKILYRDPNKRYSIQRHGKKLLSVVKVLKDYNNGKEAFADLAKLVVGEITEQDLIDSSKINK